MHDVGKLVLDRHFRSISPAEDGSGETGAGPNEAAEVEALGIDHSELGGVIAANWQLPPGIVNGIQFHHHPAGAPDDDGRLVASFVALADAVTYRIGASCGGIPKLPPDAIQRIGIDRAGFVQLCRATLSHLEETLALYSS